MILFFGVLILNWFIRLWKRRKKWHLSSWLSKTLAVKIQSVILKRKWTSWWLQILSNVWELCFPPWLSDDCFSLHLSCQMASLNTIILKKSQPCSWTQIGQRIVVDPNLRVYLAWLWTIPIRSECSRVIQSGDARTTALADFQLCLGQTKSFFFLAQTWN